MQYINVSCQIDALIDIFELLDLIKFSQNAQHCVDASGTQHQHLFERSCVVALIENWKWILVLKAS